MKKLISVLMILMLIAPAAGAEYVVDPNLKLSVLKSLYDVNAILMQLPKISDAIEIESGYYYCQENETLLFINVAEQEATDNPTYVMGCGSTENTKMDDFLLTCICMIKTMNSTEDETVLYGQLMDLYIKCRNKYPVPTVEQGSIIMIMKQDNGSYIFAVYEK